MLKISINSNQHPIGPARANEDNEGKDAESFLSFQIADHLYAVNLLQIREVRKAAALTRVAHAPSYVLGVGSIRGEIVPVIDLKERFGIKHNLPDEVQRLVLITELAGRKVGIQVDAVHSVVSISMAAVQAIPKTTMAIDLKYLVGMIEHEAQMLLLLDLEKILRPEELHAMREAVEDEALQ
jgi:purine-binding chemotaxis protein CheW